MNRICKLLIGVTLLLLTLLPREAAASATCTISGEFAIEPVDRYYCDSDYLTCTNWFESDLDVGWRGLEWMLVQVKSGSTLLKATATYDSDGLWDATFTVDSWSTCNHDVTVINYFRRIHEDDLAELEANQSYRSRLRVMDQTASSYGNSRTVSLSGNSGSTSYDSYTYQDTDTTAEGRAANTFYTANSFLKQAISWRTNLDTAFETVFEIQMDVDIEVVPPYYNGWGVYIDYDEDYARGGILRHEMGHGVIDATHHFHLNSNCADYNYHTADGVHNHWTCEYGPASTSEAYATFIAARSITTVDTSVWHCDCGSLASQDVCSDMVANVLAGNTNWMTTCGSYDAGQGTTFAIGDAWIDSIVDCVDLTISSSCSSSDRTSNKGFRNEVAMTRFLWDMVDTNNESSLDDTDETIGSFLAVLEGVTCTLNAATGTHECNQAGFQSGTCYVDRYNAYDIGYWLSGDQSDERDLNCVEDATDSPTCKATGVSCSAGSDCCSGTCNSSYCSCRLLGTACSSAGQCCTGACSTNCCYSTGVACTSGSQCCSGTCSGTPKACT